jgi:hypothetical protein
MLELLPFQGAASVLNQYHRALPWAKSKPCPFRAQADKTIHRTHVIYLIFIPKVHTNGFSQKETTKKKSEMSFFEDELQRHSIFLRTQQE